MSFAFKNNTKTTSYELNSCFAGDSRGSFDCYIRGEEAVYDNNYIMTTVNFKTKAID